ncbi:DUF1641 domain-containing protein [Calidifontibacillus oryziterrae]|uniref:DUF1641 domain-containing protein n=1 Tax=Calidifontibacillus oryziterrae TaxID=1191699 RepID=UPI0002F06931|nr:DUF1641 domain-containing protein [Calidifontibacillus oryziterrae]
MVDATKTPLSERITEDVQNELVEMLPVFVRTMNLVKMVGDTMTEETIVSLTEKAEKSSDLLNYLGDERVTNLLSIVVEKSDQLIELLAVLDRLAVLQKNGTLDRLFELAEALGVFTDALTESTIQHLVQSTVPLLELGDKITASPIVKHTPTMLEAIDRTVEDLKTVNPPAISALGLLKVIKQKEVQQALHFGLAFLKNLNVTK